MVLNRKNVEVKYIYIYIYIYSDFFSLMLKTSNSRFLKVAIFMLKTFHILNILGRKCQIEQNTVCFNNDTIMIMTKRYAFILLTTTSFVWKFSTNTLWINRSQATPNFGNCPSHLSTLLMVQKSWCQQNRAAIWKITFNHSYF